MSQEWFLIGWALVTLSLQFWCPLEYEPAGWRIPFWMMPWLPSLALLLLVFRQAAARRFLRGLAGHATRVALHRIAVQYLKCTAHQLPPPCPPCPGWLQCGGAAQ